MPLQFETPALNPDGSLKDAADMEWDESPTQPGPLTLKLPARPRPNSPTPSWKTTSALALKFASLAPADFTNPLKRKANPAPAETSESKHVDPALPKGQAGANPKSKKAPKPPAITRVKPNELHRTASSTSVDDNTDDTTSEPSKKKRKRGDGAADILTVFKLVDVDDPSQGYICEPCV